jgi:hypothetical protein
MQLESVQFLIIQAIVHIQTGDFSHESVTNVVNYLLSKTKAVNITYAEFWGFDISKLPGEGVNLVDTVNEFKKTGIVMDKNLHNSKLALELAKDVETKTITREAVRLALRTNFKF